jgi:Tfp pilus assembly protein FimT
MRIWAIWTVQTAFPKDEVWFGLLQLLVVTTLLATLAILAVPHVLSLRQKSHVATFTAIAEPILQILARSAARINGHYPLTAAIEGTDGNAGWQSRMKSWAIWTIQTVFPKDEAWFGLPQLLMVTALLATLAMLAVPHVLSLRQKGYVVTITAEASPVRYAGHDLCCPGWGDLHAASDCGCA